MISVVMTGRRMKRSVFTWALPLGWWALPLGWWALPLGWWALPLGWWALPLGLGLRA
jgi:hypothetical protein